MRQAYGRQATSMQHACDEHATTDDRHATGGHRADVAEAARKIIQVLIPRRCRDAGVPGACQYDVLNTVSTAQPALAALSQRSALRPAIPGLKTRNS